MLERDLMAAYLQLDGYPDVPATLRRLKKRDLQRERLPFGPEAGLQSLDELPDLFEA